MIPVEEVQEFATSWTRWEQRRRDANRIGRAIARAQTPARVYSVREHRRRVMLALVAEYGR